MITFADTDAQNRFGEVLDAAQREPDDIVSGYQGMAADTEREREALEWD